MPIRVKAMLAVLVVLMVIGTVVALNLGVSGDQDASLSKPAGVERYIPESGSHNLSQSTVGIDLADGYEGYLIVENVAIDNPADEQHPDGLMITPGQQIFQYSPGPGRRVTKLSSPTACVTAMIWKAKDGRATAKPAAWCFKTT